MRSDGEGERERERERERSGWRETRDETPSFFPSLSHPFSFPFPTVHRLPYSAVNFWAYEKLTAAWIERGWGGGWAGGGGPGASGHGGRPSDTIRRLACGGGAGLAACALAYPLDLVRTRLAAQMATSTSGGLPPAGISGTLRGIISAEGARGLYRGLGATLAQVAPALAINYSVYGRLRAAWMEGRPPGEPPTVR